MPFREAAAELGVPDVVVVDAFDTTRDSCLVEAERCVDLELGMGGRVFAGES